MRSGIAALAAAALVQRAPGATEAAGPDGSSASPFYEDAGSATGIVNDALRGCGIGNCVSTSNTAGSPEDYGAPWRAPEGMTPARAADALVAAFEASGEGTLTASSTVRGSAGEGEKRYLRFASKGPFGDDIVEFLIADEQVLDRNWEGDRAGCLVTYSSRGFIKVRPTRGSPCPALTHSHTHSLTRSLTRSHTRSLTRRCEVSVPSHAAAQRLRPAAEAAGGAQKPTKMADCRLRAHRVLPMIRDALRATEVRRTHKRTGIQGRLTARRACTGSE